MLLFVCAAEKAASGGWGIHGATELRNHGKRGARNNGVTESLMGGDTDLRNYEFTENVVKQQE